MPSLNLQNLLWSTRGKEWGFRFIHQPESNSGLWEEIYQGIFGRNDRVPQRWHGTIIQQDGSKISYVASRFFDHDTTWKDMAGREIPQEMLFVIGNIPISEVADLTWEYVVMDQLRSFYRDAYDKDINVVQTFQPATDETELPTTHSTVDAIKLDIQLTIRGASEKATSNAIDPLSGKFSRILHTDVMELLGRKKPS